MTRERSAYAGSNLVGYWRTWRKAPRSYVSQNANGRVAGPANPLLRESPKSDSWARMRA